MVKKYILPSALAALGISFLGAYYIASAATVTINVGDNWQTVVNANPAGTTYSIAAGTHRMQTVAPKNGDKFIGQPGAIMNGGKVLYTKRQHLTINLYTASAHPPQQLARKSDTLP